MPPVPPLQPSTRPRISEHRQLLHMLPPDLDMGCVGAGVTDQTVARWSPLVPITSSLDSLDSLDSLVRSDVCEMQTDANGGDGDGDGGARVSAPSPSSAQLGAALAR